MTLALLQTKLHVPPVRPNLVPRPRLIRLLSAGLGRGRAGFACRLTLVSAPAGFGKTTLVAHWIDQAGFPCAWLSLDEGDNDPVRFWTYLIAALQSADPTIGQVAQSLLGTPRPPVEPLVTILVNDIAAAAKPFLLVLDDYHVLHLPELHDGLDLLLAHLPPTLQIVLVTRQVPPLALPRLRVRGQLAQVGEDDLRFTSEEASAFLNQAIGSTLDDRTVSTLEARTEGWIAGLQLAALSIQGRSPERIEELVQGFGGSHRHVIDYLAGEVLGQQRDEIRQFLLQTSILDRMSAPLCDALTGRRDGQEMLRHLEQANLFLVPLDEERRWFRYHHLFADFLRSELDPEARSALHARASRWLVSHDLAAEAVGHALATGDPEEAARVIALAADGAFRMASFITLEGWLDALPDRVIRARSLLATYKGFVLWFTGRAGRSSEWIQAAEQSLPADRSPSLYGRLLALKAHRALSVDSPEATTRLCREALANLDAGDAPFRHLTQNLLGQVLEMQGDVVSAAGVYREAADHKWGTGNDVGALVMLTNLVFALNELGRRGEAVSVCRLVTKEAVSQTGRSLPVSEGIYLAWSLLSYEANDLEEARRQVTQTLELGERMKIAEGVLWGRYILARLHLARGELSEMRRVTGEGHTYAAHLDVHRGKLLWFSALEAQADLQEGNLAAAEHWAKAAGLTPSDTPHHWDEFSYLTYVRLLLAQNRRGEAQILLATMQRSAEASHRHRKLITIYLLQALLQHSLGHSKQALARIEDALALAAPEGYLRAFLDEGPVLVALMAPLRARLAGTARRFADGVMEAAATTGPAPAATRPRAPVEPLNDRELEILRLMAAGRSNPEIAQVLYLSLNTVKWHVKNLYGKLQVGNRVEAVDRARELGLLSSTL